MTTEERKQYMQEYNKKYYIKNKEKEINRAQSYRENNPDKAKESRLKHENKNPDRKKEYIKNRRKLDNLFKIKTNISNLIRITFKNKSMLKNSKSTDILCCSILDLTQYIENMWSLPDNLNETGDVWMTWENYGNPKDGIYELNKTWDIDHIIPTYIAKTEEKLIELNHYTNLQPLCSYKNRFIKSNKIR